MFCKNCGNEAVGSFCENCGNDMLGGSQQTSKTKIPLALKIAITVLCDLPLIYIFFPSIAFLLSGDISLFSIIGTFWSLGLLYLINIHIYVAKKPMDNTIKIIITIVAVALGISLLFLGLLP